MKSRYSSLRKSLAVELDVNTMIVNCTMDFYLKKILYCSMSNFWPKFLYSLELDKTSRNFIYILSFLLITFLLLMPMIHEQKDN